MDHEDKQFTKKMPDWNRFFGSQSKGDIVNNITRKMFDFVAHGAHVGSILEMNMHICTTSDILSNPFDYITIQND